MLVEVCLSTFNTVQILGDYYSSHTVVHLSNLELGVSQNENCSTLSITRFLLAERIRQVKSEIIEEPHCMISNPTALFSRMS